MIVEWNHMQLICMWNVDVTMVMHVNFIVTSCGLCVNSNKVFLCASPDRLVECQCCGKGLFEVKCSFTSSNVNLSNVGLPYIVKMDGIAKLKTNRAYYSQIQLQMAVTGRHYCDFFVFSPLGYILQ